MLAHVNGLYRYPVKGLMGERLQSAQLDVGCGMPLDRAYAIAHGTTQFDPDAPTYLQKTYFLALMTHPRLAGLRVSFEEMRHEIQVERQGAPAFTANLSDEVGRAAFSAYLDEFIGGEAKGTPRVVTARGHMFSDVRDRCLSVLNLASIAALSEQAGQVLDPQRFRANVYVDGLDPWDERSWAKGAEISLGDVRLRVLKPISRCAAINVNLQSARVDCNLPLLLKERFERNFMGVYAEVIGGGTVHDGAPVTPPASEESAS